VLTDRSHALPQARGVLHHHEYGPSVPATVHGAPRSAKACFTGTWPCIGRLVSQSMRTGAAHDRQARAHAVGKQGDARPPAPHGYL